jgi:hypothetical protein
MDGAMRRLVVACMLAVGLATTGLALTACGDDEHVAVDEHPMPPRQHEILTERPSGFWTSNRPAMHGAYRWRIMAVGGCFLAVTIFVMIRLVRRANTERASRDKSPKS